MKVATLEDLPEVLDMSMEFINQMYFGKYADTETVSKLLTGILSDTGLNSIVILEPGKGMIVGLVSPFLYGNHLIASELGWYVHEEHRKSSVGRDLLEAFEYWAKEKAGCTMVVMGSFNNKLDKFYKDRGYETHEQSYLKVM